MLAFDTRGFAIVGTDPKSADAATPEAYPRIRVRQDMGDSAVREDVDQKRFPAEGHHRIETARRLTQRPLDGSDLRNVTQVTRNAKGLRVGELWLGKEPGKHLRGPALVCDDPGAAGIAAQSHHLHRQGTDVYAHVGHGGNSGPGC